MKTCQATSRFQGASDQQIEAQKKAVQARVAEKLRIWRGTDKKHTPPAVAAKAK